MVQRGRGGRGDGRGFVVALRVWAPGPLWAEGGNGAECWFFLVVVCVLCLVFAIPGLQPPAGLGSGRDGPAAVCVRAWAVGRRAGAAPVPWRRVALQGTVKASVTRCGLGRPICSCPPALTGTRTGICSLPIPAACTARAVCWPCLPVAARMCCRAAKPPIFFFFCFRWFFFFFVLFFFPPCSVLPNVSIGVSSAALHAFAKPLPRAALTAGS
jgi:hypothetical protein